MLEIYNYTKEIIRLKIILLTEFYKFLVVLFGISFFTFSLTYLSPGDPAEIMLTECGNIPTPELVEQTRAELGLDKPFAEQYFRWAF